MRELGPFAALDWHFGVQCDSEAAIELVEQVLGPLATHASSQSVYRYMAPRGREFGALMLDDQLLLRSRNAWLLYARLLWHINIGAIEATSGATLLHAAAAEHLGRVVVMPATMESGKSTLVTGLVASGLNYVTDETVALEPATLRVRPHPKAVHLDHGSWSLFPNLAPRLSPEAQELLNLQWQVPPERIRRESVSSGGHVAVVIFPTYASGAQTTLRALSPGQALVRALQQTFALDRQRARDMDVLARLLSSVPAYDLISGSLVEAVEAVRSALDAG